MTKLGFTGTSKGMTDAQHVAVAAILERGGYTELHHGECIGADYQAGKLARAMAIKVVGHPPDNSKARADGKRGRPLCIVDERWDPAPYLVRDRHIVDNTASLLAAPGSMYETPRSGTWATIRMARSINRPVIIVTPDGATWSIMP